MVFGRNYAPLLWTGVGKNGGAGAGSRGSDAGHVLEGPWDSGWDSWLV